MSDSMNCREGLYMEYNIETFLENVQLLYPVDKTRPDAYVRVNLSNVIKSRLLKDIFVSIFPPSEELYSVSCVLLQNSGELTRTSKEVLQMCDNLRSMMLLLNKNGGSALLRDMMCGTQTIRNF